MIAFIDDHRGAYGVEPPGNPGRFILRGLSADH
jgi:hypothetical protein